MFPAKPENRASFHPKSLEICDLKTLSEPKTIKESDWCKGTSPDSLSHFFSSFLLPTIGAYLSFTQRHAREMNGKIRSALVAFKQKTKRQPLNCAVLPKEFSCGSKRCGEFCDLTSAWEMRIELTHSRISAGD